MICPRCSSNKIIKSGSIHNGKQKFQCNDCARQFVKNPENKPIFQETRNLIDRFLLEKIPLAGIARILDVSEF